MSLRYYRFPPLPHYNYIHWGHTSHYNRERGGVHLKLLGHHTMTEGVHLKLIGHLPLIRP